MTGLPVLDEERENPDIITHVDYKMHVENTDFIKLMDKRMEHNFGEESVQKMYSIVTDLLAEKVYKRSDLKTVGIQDFLFTPPNVCLYRVTRQKKK